MFFIFNRKSREIISSLSSARQKYVNTGLIPPEVFRELERADFTATKKYLEWMCKAYHDSFSSKRREEERDVPNIKFINQLKFDIKRHASLSQASLVEKNIDSFPDLNSLEDALRDAEADRNLSDAYGADLEEGEDYQVEHENGVWKVFQILTFEASRKIGSGTKWCTVANRRSFDQYMGLGIGIYYAINKKNGQKVAYALTSDYYQRQGGMPVFMMEAFDSNNVSIKSENLLKVLGIPLERYMKPGMRRLFAPNQDPRILYDINDADGPYQGRGGAVLQALMRNFRDIRLKHQMFDGEPRVVIYEGEMVTNSLEMPGPLISLESYSVTKFPVYFNNDYNGAMEVSELPMVHILYDNSRCLNVAAYSGASESVSDCSFSKSIWIRGKVENSSFENGSHFYDGTAINCSFNGGCRFYFGDCLNSEEGVFITEKGRQIRQDVLKSTCFLFQDSFFLNGTFNGGWFKNSVFEDGVFEDGVWEMSGSEWKGGEWVKGWYCIEGVYLIGLEEVNPKQMEMLLKKSGFSVRASQDEVFRLMQKMFRNNLIGVYSLS